MPGISIPRPSLTPSFHSFLPLKVVGPQGDGIVFFFFVLKGLVTRPSLVSSTPRSVSRRGPWFPNPGKVTVLKRRAAMAQEVEQVVS